MAGILCLFGEEANRRLLRLPDVVFGKRPGECAEDISCDNDCGLLIDQRTIDGVDLRGPPESLWVPETPPYSELPRLDGSRSPQR